MIMPQIIRKAFTLIELLVVIAIIGILSGLIVVSMSGVTEKANLAKAQVFSNSLRNSLMADIVSEWKFDNSSAIDSWGSNNGTIVGATNTANCVYNSCLDFNGSSYVDLNAGGGIINAFAISMWFNSRTISTTQRMINWRQASGDNNEIRFMISGSKFEGLIIHSSGSATGYKDYFGATTLQSNTWYFGVLSWDGTNLKLYINGKEDIPYNKGNDSVVVMTDTTRNRRFGGATAGVAYFNGLIDETRIYDVNVPVSQIKESYYLGLNKLLNSGGITGKEYQSRVLDLNNRYGKR
jgi:prepilin-type N-terminal cleavage/methylation domain-containing protein